MFVTGFIVNLFSFLLGSSLLSISFSLIIYALIIRFILLPIGRQLIPILSNVVRLVSKRPTSFVFLELTPSAGSETTPQATAELLSAVYHLLLGGTWYERMLSGPSRLSLELVATKASGIRYILGVPNAGLDIVKSLLNSYQPEIKLKVVEDYLPTRFDQDNHNLHLLSFNQSGYFAYPLKSRASDETHDFIGYLAGAMTKLREDELMSFQIVLKPSLSSAAVRLRNHLQSGNSGRFSFWASPFRAVQGPAYNLAGSAQPEFRAKILDKLAQPLFTADIRSLVLTSDEHEAKQRLESFHNALALFALPGYQGLRQRYNSWLPFARKYRLFQFQNRLNSLLSTDSSLLATSEVSGLYHFPYGQATKIENVSRSRFATLPAPISLKNGTKLDVIIGRNIHQDLTTPIGLTVAERERHVYILGGTGNGKSTILESMIVSDIASGKGVAVIDPHGDLATALLGYVPKDRVKDVVYFNPRDYDYPIGLNLLELPVGLSGSELAHEKDMVTEAVVSVLRRIFDNQTDTSAYRIERILRNTIHTALTIEGATLFTVLRLLSDTAYRRTITHQLSDVSLKRFWTEEMNKAGDMQRIKLTGGPIARIERFERSESARRVLGQAHSTINFDELIDSGKILICNFSKGHLGEDTSALFGTTVMAELQLAAWRRQNLAPNKRRPFYVYVDEFQNFANDSFASLLTEARKYKLYLTIAEQSTAQQDERLVEVMLNNVGTVICFRTGSPRDERLILHQFNPLVQSGDINNLPAYNFYMRIAAQSVYEPFSGETILPLQPGSEAVAAAAMQSSREHYTGQNPTNDTNGQSLIDNIPSSNKTKPKNVPAVS